MILPARYDFPPCHLIGADALRTVIVFLALIPICRDILGLLNRWRKYRGTYLARWVTRVRVGKLLALWRAGSELADRLAAIPLSRLRSRFASDFHKVALHE
jgi:hypothetical protein